MKVSEDEENNSSFLSRRRAFSARGYRLDLTTGCP